MIPAEQRQTKAAAAHPLLAVGAFLGTVIGVGMFGLPYLAAQMGLLPLIVLFVFLTPVVLAIHLRFAGVVLGTRGQHRIPGYVHAYLGERWRRFSLVVSALGLLGALLAYLIVGGTFLRLVAGPVTELSPLLATILFFLCGAALISRGTRSVASVDFALTLVFFLLVLLLLMLALPSIDPSVFRGIDWPSSPVGYGVVLFSLWGLSLVPETVELVGRKKTAARRVLTYGLVATAGVYLIFTIMVFGVTGAATTPEAISGFVARFPPVVTLIGGVLGLITTFTSYIALGLTLKKTLTVDLRLAPAAANLGTLGLPLLLFLVGLTNFINVLGLTGAVLLGLEGMLVIAVAERYRLTRVKRGSGVLNTALGVILALGVIIELWVFWRQ
ncbi:MAG: hypothetical protein HY340_00235 [Candidatus Kerfeldbacteria bacterium]|nr:hypothetical protein [Candidatus Kerfeldbacteria bacterium]